MYGVDVLITVSHINADIDIQVTARFHVLIDARFLGFVLCRLIVMVRRCCSERRSRKQSYQHSTAE